MLIVSRKKDESIVIQCPNGDTLSIVVCKTGSQVRIGVEAPKEYLIFRKELIHDHKSN